MPCTFIGALHLPTITTQWHPFAVWHINKNVRIRKGYLFFFLCQYFRFLSVNKGNTAKSLNCVNSDLSVTAETPVQHHKAATALFSWFWGNASGVSSYCLVSLRSWQNLKLECHQRSMLSTPNKGDSKLTAFGASIVLLYMRGWGTTRVYFLNF